MPADFAAQVAAIRKLHGLSVEFPGQSYTEGLESLSEQQQKSFNAAYQAIYPKATLEDYVNHIDYLVKRIGVDHVGIGSDFNHGSGSPGFNDESEAPNVTRELLRRGYTEEQIAKIWGGNFLRVFREAEARRSGCARPEPCLAHRSIQRFSGALRPRCSSRR